MSKSTLNQIYSKIFDESSFLKALPFLAILPLVVFIISFLIVSLFPVLKIEFPIQLNFILVPLCAGLIVILMRLIFRNSLFFRITFYFSITITVTVCAAFYLSFLGMNISNALLLYPACVCIIIVMLIYAVRSIQIPLNLSMDQIKKIAEGNLNVEKAGIGVYGAEFKEFESTLLLMMTNIATIISTVQLSVDNLTNSTKGINVTSEELNALSEEIAATIQQISRGATTQSEMAINGVVAISKMSNVVDTSLKDIGSTLNVIDDIASQTNILALNAAIEAARAGEYGRGFAVVADNVRRLAEETKKNSADINKITSRIIQDVGASLKDIQESFQNFSAQSEEFSASSEEVAAATEEESASMQQLVQLTQDLSKIAEELNNATQQFQIS